MNPSSLQKFLFLLLFLGFTSLGFSQNLILSDNARASVITCDTGNESYSLFGHTAIRIADPDNSIDMVYNYGAFDFATPNFVIKFAKGDLQYFAVAHPFADFIDQYVYEKRSVYEQELIIPAVYKQQLFDNLNAALQSEERFYTYKFIDKNCTSMVVDMLNKTLGARVIVKKADTDITYRTILYPYFNNSFYQKLGTSIIFGTKVDALGTQIFLPFELQKSLALIQFQKHPLCKASQTLLEVQKEVPNTWWDNSYTLLLLLGIILLINKTGVDLFYFAIMGLLGVFFVFVGFYSSHQELACNYNILLFNPGLLLLIYFYARKYKKGIYYACLFHLLSLAVYLVVMGNKAHLWIVLPLVVTSTVLLLKMVFWNSKRIPIII
jgi:hypothetical protein